MPLRKWFAVFKSVNNVIIHIYIYSLLLVTVGSDTDHEEQLTSFQ